jgi:hypothetical protein
VPEPGFDAKRISPGILLNRPSIFVVVIAFLAFLLFYLGFLTL